MNPKSTKMFSTLHTTYKNIVSCLGVIGYLEEDIIKRGINTNKNLQLNCLYAYPNKEDSFLNPFTYEMMFPDNNHKIPCPKFFTLTLTNQQATHSYLYCLKFSEQFSLPSQSEETKDIDVPIVIFIKSEKEDLESFKQLLNVINYIIVNDDIETGGNLNLSNNNINDYKKVQLINIFYFLFSLPHAPPHSLVKLKIDKEIINYNCESIDFYFSSNCEIPCNKNDTDINILFLLLDQSIIIKVLFAILKEKQIVFRASQAYLLNIIIPTFLKLIFPFKWLQSFITVLPKEKLNFLEAPGSFIFGVLSDVISLNELMSEYPGKIVVDCDTNEIFGDSYLEPYEPPKFLSGNLNEKMKSNENTNINKSNKLFQGNNLINISGSYLYKYEAEPNNKKIKINFDEKNNIIIDVQKGQLFIDKTYAFVNSNEWKWLRKNIQLVRNPEIFDLENINKKRDSGNSIYINDEENENVILPNRSFSYNIQNIFMIYILNKLFYTESEFMSIFKNTNLFLAYNENNKFQNDSGKRIVENILDLKLINQERNINNCFIIEYVLQSFKARFIIDKINSKLGSTSNLDNMKENIYKNIKLVLNNYIHVKNEEDSNNLNDYDDIYNIKENSDGRKSEMRKQAGRSTKSIIRIHERTKTSLLRDTCNSINFNLVGADKSLKGSFKFYGNDGFFNFIGALESFLTEENINIKEELYEKNINDQIVELIINNEDIFNKNIMFSESNNLNIINPNNSYKLEKANALSIKDIKKIKLMTTIPEYTKEEEDEKEKNNKIEVNNDYYGRTNVIIKNRGDENIFNNNSQSKSNEGGLSYSLTSAINGMYSDEMDINKFLYSENIINFFPNFSEHNELNKNLVNENDDNANRKSQYYLFIISILENILENKDRVNELEAKIKKKKQINEINIKILILKIYRIAYQLSGKKHRDFPYFTYYNFLLKINLEELKALKNVFENMSNKEQELYEIYSEVVFDLESILAKEIERKKKKEMREREREKRLKEKEDEENEIKIKKKGSVKMIDFFNYFESNIFEKKKDKNKVKKISLGKSQLEFNYFISYIINIEPEFECEYKYKGFNYIIIDLAEEILSLLPKKKVCYNKSSQDIIDEVNKKLIENNKIFELVGQLKYIYPENLPYFKSRICFWLNCFNFLILFTIFYKKWNLSGQDDWKYFLQNVSFIIGEKNYSFNDMQYLLFKKPLFLCSSYKSNEMYKKFRIDKTEDAKTMEKKYSLLYNPFLVYLPTKDFPKPIIFKENEFEYQFIERIKNYTSNFIYIEGNNIFLPEHLTNYYPRFLYKEYKKFNQLIKDNIYYLIKEKKYKGHFIKPLDWRLDFESLLDN